MANRPDQTNPGTLPDLQAPFFEAAREQLSKVMTLPDFMEMARQRPLTLEHLKSIVEQATLLLDQNYAHLPLKRSLHGVDPVRRLKRLSFILANAPEGLEKMGFAAPDQLTPTLRQLLELRFHREMISIFTSVRDLHTVYMMPEPYRDMVAFLPFKVGEYFDAEHNPRYIVTATLAGLEAITGTEADKSFRRGVELLDWNAAPLVRYVSRLADRHAGSNLPARHARGLARLTLRPLSTCLPPHEYWVIVGFRGDDGERHEIKLDWHVFPDSERSRIQRETLKSASEVLTTGLDVDMDLSRRGMLFLYEPELLKQRPAQVPGGGGSGGRLTEAARHVLELPPLEALEPIATELPCYLDAFMFTWPQEQKDLTFGRIRIRTFNVEDIDAFCQEVLRLLELMAHTDGLIIDVRGNVGGRLPAGERLLQLFTPVKIEPAPFHFRSTPLNLQFCKRSKIPDHQVWGDSILQALQTGAVYSRGVPITSSVHANNVGQRYYAPVVLLTDALCYSTTDFFIAGFADHGVGDIIGAAGNTGAGGANVAEHAELLELYAKGGGDESPYEPLPRGMEMHVALRRSSRVLANAETPLEDLGVAMPRVHNPTLDDLLQFGIDLYGKAAERLAQRQRRRVVLKLDLEDRPGEVRLHGQTRNITWLEAIRDGHPLRSVELDTGKVKTPWEATWDHTWKVEEDWTTFEVRGHRRGTPVAYRKWQRSEFKTAGPAGD